MCRNIRIKFISWAYMYTTLTVLGKRVIQTNPSKFDEMLFWDILRLKQGREIHDFIFWGREFQRDAPATETGEGERDWLIDWTLFLNGEDTSTKADSHICRCYSTTNNQEREGDLDQRLARAWMEREREGGWELGRERETGTERAEVLFVFCREVFGGLGWLVATLVASERVMVEQNGWRRTSIARSARWRGQNPAALSVCQLPGRHPNQSHCS